jgi:hypothetical protein
MWRKGIMSQMGQLNVLLRSIQKTLVKNGPAIATAVGVGGFFTAGFLMIKATKDATKNIEKAEQVKLCEAKDAGCDVVEEPLLSPKEKFQAVWKCYIPPVVIGVASASCVFGARKVDAQRNVALATAYSLAQTSFDEYKASALEELGEKKEEKIRERIDKKHLEEKPESKAEIIATSEGNDLFYDSYSGRYFYSSTEKIDAAINRLNAQILGNEYGSLNDFYYEIKIPPIFPLGESLGWNVCKFNSRRDMLAAKYDTQFSDMMKPCGVLRFNIDPKWDFQDYFPVK